MAALNGEINPLGYPHGRAVRALLGVGGVQRTEHGESGVALGSRRPSGRHEISGYDLAEEVAGTYRGMMIAVPKDEWVVFHGISPQELSPFRKHLASTVRLSEFRKQPRGPKKPHPQRQSGAKIDQACGDRQIA